MIEAPGIWLVRKEAEPIGEALVARLGGALYRPWLAPTAQRQQFAEAYRRHARWILVCATGIAVRYLDGLTQDKRSDPAVVVLDEAARFAIALLGGHEGGANALAYAVARAMDAVPVVTTATETLKPLVVGIGCRRGTPEDRIDAAVRKALGARDLEEVREVATIDLKADEGGLLAWCERHTLPLRVIARETVASRPWAPNPSDWVQQNVGVDGVCEPCALIAVGRGRLLVRKMICDGVAVAVVEDGIWKQA